MKETIILAPGANGTELLRSLARFGKNTIGCRVMSAVELARYALQKCGKTIDLEFLPRKDEAAVYYSFLNDIPYFSAASYSDAQNLANTIYAARSLVEVADDYLFIGHLLKGEFDEKNQAMAEAFAQYSSKLTLEKKIDSIGLIRKAIKEQCKFTADFLAVKEFSLTPLEMLLFRSVSGSHVVKQVSLSNLFDAHPAQTGQQSAKVSEYIKAYGASNEVAYVFGEIYKKQLPLDSCVVALASTDYEQLFLDFALAHKISVTFGCGVPISNSAPAHLLKALYDWNFFGNNGIDALKKVVFSDGLDRAKLQDVVFPQDITLQNGCKIKPDDVITCAGNLRLSFDEVRNKNRISAYRQTIAEDSDEAKILNCAEKLGEILSLGYVGIIEKYSVVRKNNEFLSRIDRSAVKVICQTLKTFSEYMKQGESVDEIISDVLSKTVCSENSREGCLHITSLSDAFSTLRKNLFVVGLSNDVFPGIPCENYLLLDNDFRQFRNNNYAPTSEKVISQRKEGLEWLCKFALTMGTSVRLSYSAYDLAELKLKNPSSSMFEIYKDEYEPKPVTLRDFEENLTNVGFFDNVFTNSDAFGQAVKHGKQFDAKTCEKEELPIVAADRVFSPTEIEQFVECPRAFLLQRLLNIKPIEENDPFLVVEHTEKGNMAHRLMQELAEKKLSQDEFLNCVNMEFDNYMKRRPPIHQKELAGAREKFVDMMRYAYELDNDKTIACAEAYVEATHPSGIKIKGRLDRLERDDNGEYIVVDYKTSGSLSHFENDAKTCIQALLYAYMAEQQNYKVARCEFRYLQLKQTVVCEYSEAMKSQLDQILYSLKDSLENAQFVMKEKENDCDSYCEFKSICGIREKGERENDE